MDCAPLGGAPVTGDIARGLSTPVSAAERIKALHGCALDSPDDEQVMIEAPPVGADAGSGMAPIVFELDEKKTVALCGCKHNASGEPFCNGAHSKL